MRKIAWIMSMLLLLPTLIVPGAAADSDAGIIVMTAAAVSPAGTVVLKKKR